jgi:hypothetical protein
MKTLKSLLLMESINPRNLSPHKCKYDDETFSRFIYLKTLVYESK